MGWSGAPRSALGAARELAVEVLMFLDGADVTTRLPHRDDPHRVL